MKPRRKSTPGAVILFMVLLSCIPRTWEAKSKCKDGCVTSAITCFATVQAMAVDTIECRSQVDPGRQSCINATLVALYPICLGNEKSCRANCAHYGR